ncbi:phage tail protein [Xylella fastidiosa subsp. pauca]|uniref:phage tail protein n=1 Tax=Xylella fastidiosa TaxID=2371 RepID=UPI00249F51D5|nr:phage tail protein [Xylella fastidiosa]WGZ33012.1 phage tail protein [Xylella fastidiosa subsp. pauca]
MTEHYFRTPFAHQGDRIHVPEAKDSHGFVSYTQGWGPDYQKDLTKEPTAKPVERTVMNAVLHAITTVLKGYQEYGSPEFITAEQNNGTPFSYMRGVIVRYRPDHASRYGLYLSTADNNTDTPLQNEPNRWTALSRYEPGQIVYTAGKRALPGTLLCDGRAVSRAMYPRLFEEINTRYGAGDGSTTFNIPNFLEGTVGVHTADPALVGTFTSGQVISHAHTATAEEGGTHLHPVTIHPAGRHTHPASAAAAGNHLHQAWTDEQGLHQHTGSTSWDGDHAHILGSFRAIYASGRDMGFYEQNQGKVTTNVTGGHLHRFTTDANGKHAHNIGMQAAGLHVHDIAVTAEADHAHAATAESAGRHGHTVSIDRFGEHHNLPAGLRVMACIAY